MKKYLTVEIVDEGDSFRARCIDLSIEVPGTTSTEAYNNLQKRINEFFNETPLQTIKKIVRKSSSIRRINSIEINGKVQDVEDVIRMIGV